MIPPQHQQMDNTAQVAEKVLRRIEIAKVQLRTPILETFADCARLLEICKIVLLSQALKLKMAGRTAH